MNKVIWNETKQYVPVFAVDTRYHPHTLKMCKRGTHDANKYYDNTFVLNLIQD